MMNKLLNGTKSLTGRLTLFFITLSTVIALYSYLIFFAALHISEDRLSEQRIRIDMDAASQRFLNGESGKIKLDNLSNAYNDLSILPSFISQNISGKDTFLNEIGEYPYSRLIMKSYYIDNGKKYPIVIETKVDEVELTSQEVIIASALVFTLLAILLFSFGGVLSRLSQHFIEPINQLSEQLNEKKLNTNDDFFISDNSAIEFHQLSQQLNKYRYEISSLIKREQAFARYASHELRTPLTIIKGSSKLLQKVERTPFDTRQIERINDATFQMTTMIDALLSLVKYEREKDNSPLRIFSQQELSTIIKENFIQANQKNIEIHLDFYSEPQIRASTAVMNMLIGNLLRNAIAATENGDIHIKITENHLTIKDSGLGLTSKVDSNGHGLGLLIVNDFCKRYGWTFKLSNDLNRGCNAEIKFN
ncbi:HAMP domain-containing histidine kinase [Aliivibrio fischeri]|uniref:sensor histidine kinase n=1 Tax=Aliivibrio fischeri TaxID=668 RepID=UPI0007C487D9|nr:HAMP domain-containing sensor histidine kinase [Aliivibrio fischeri]MCE7576088.1 HAMP domain-containing histidine kinase [Aliivibrio fischeri]MCE7588378.1 HAMP domain-containing histidine kinase [Aliivibrio fischeri]